MTDLKACPDEYYYNCSNALKKCDVCAAGKALTKKLYYSPVDTKILGRHPYAILIKNISVHNKNTDTASKKGIRNEHKVKTRLNRKIHNKVKKEDKTNNTNKTNLEYVKSTIGSGRVNQDGDHKILEFIQSDCKLRTTTVGFTLTHIEYKKGIKQGTNQWIITNKNNETVYVLTEELYVLLISQLVTLGIANE